MSTADKVTKLFPATTRRLEAMALGWIGITVCSAYLACYMTNGNGPLANSSAAVVALNFIVAVVAGPAYVPIALVVLWLRGRKSVSTYQGSPTPTVMSDVSATKSTYNPGSRQQFGGEGF